MSNKVAGQALVEFALVLLVLMLLFMGIFDFGRLVFAYNDVSNAAREGARRAIVTQDSTAIRDEALAATTGLDSASVTVTVTNCTAPVKIGCLIAVNVEYPWRAITPIIGNVVGPITLRATTTMPVEHVAP